jgi:hypothetical protein
MKSMSKLVLFVILGFNVAELLCGLVQVLLSAMMQAETLGLKMLRVLDYVS